MSTFANSDRYAKKLKTERKVRNFKRTQPVRLYTKAAMIGYTRNLANQKNHTALLKVEGVQTPEEARFYCGKRVAYIYRVHKKDSEGRNFR